MKKLVVALNKRQYGRLLKLLLDMPPRDLTVEYGTTELYAFDVTSVGEIEQQESWL